MHQKTWEMSLFLHFLSIIESRLRKKSSWTHFKVPNRSTFKNDLKLQSKNLSLIFQKIVEHLEKSCDQRAKKSGHILFCPMGIITMWYILLCRTPMTSGILGVDRVGGKTRWNQRFIQTFGACNCCLANAANERKNDDDDGRWRRSVEENQSQERIGARTGKSSVWFGNFLLW